MALRIIQGKPAKDTDTRVGRLPTPVKILIILLIVLVLALSVLLIATLARGSEPGGGDTPAESATPTATATAVDVEDFQSRLSAWQAANSDPVVEEVAPGLNRCSSRTEAANTATYTTPTGNTYGTGFDRDIQGAVAASAEALRYMTSKDWVLPDLTMMEYYFLDGDNRLTTEELVERRKEMGVDDRGRVLDSNGLVIDDSELRYAGYPKYGIYRLGVISQTTAGPGTVAIDWILPYVRWKFGVEESPTAYTSLMSMVMIWRDGDWHVKTWYRTGTFEPDGSPYVNPPFEITSIYATTLGGPWCVPADGTDAAIPGYWATRP